MEGLPTPLRDGLTSFCDMSHLPPCFAQAGAGSGLTNDMLPSITLEPPPEHWPDPATFLPPEH